MRSRSFDAHPGPRFVGRTQDDSLPKRLLWAIHESLARFYRSSSGAGSKALRGLRAEPLRGLIGKIAIILQRLLLPPATPELLRSFQWPRRLRIPDLLLLVPS